MKLITHDDKTHEVGRVKRIVLDGDEDHLGVEIYVPGFKHDPDSTDAAGTQFFIENYYGKLRLYVWDGDSEDPHVITIEPLTEAQVVT